MENMRPWLLKVDRHDFFDLREKSEEDVQVITKSLSKDAHVGDLVFLVGDDYRAEKGSWRIGGIFRVMSAPKWHPMNGYEVLLGLIARPQTAIPFEINTGATPIDFGVIELDSAGLARMIDSIEDFVKDEKDANIMLGEIAKFRMVS